MSFPRRVRGLAYLTFYRLPLPVRRGLAKLISPRYVVGAVTILRDSEVADGPDRLVLLRQPHRGGWGLPAGLLKKHEQPVVGAARELFEETGVRVDPADMTAASPNAVIHVVGVVDTVFLASVPASTTPLVVDGAEVLEAAWFPVDDLPRLSANTALLLGRYGIGPMANAE
ncbi:NUDIX domain-containing protein [Actinoplanes sp. KI2]|uniref:NUDIX domain-containing protein n=1 Tax=Actinoplanes sp. KI2 TaxID=2983315 RepID=UPI0021D5A650|nr:NUDIX domain-containing protein [Actinoplanes sp. KI2]MCU7725692.1 NUDIX domain-containing protein [Actinoplanes sp. KI2]